MNKKPDIIDKFTAELVWRIKMIMKEKGISQKELAKMINMGESTLSKYLNYYRDFSIRQLKHIAEALEVKISDITGD